MSWNIYFKGNNARFDSFEYIMNKHYMHLLDVDDKRYHHEQKDWAVDLDYNSIFNLYKLTELYYNVNKEVCPDFKIKYALNYIDQHVKLYNRWEYRAMEQIFVFEYQNKLHESISNRSRSWSIDNITKDNWQTLLKENLCPNKLPLNTVLAAIDKKDYGFYDRPLLRTTKTIKSFLLNRYVSLVKGSSELQAYYPMAGNQRVNCTYFELAKHPKLVWQLLCTVSPGMGTQFIVGWT